MFRLIGISPQYFLHLYNSSFNEPRFRFQCGKQITNPVDVGVNLSERTVKFCSERILKLFAMVEQMISPSIKLCGKSLSCCDGLSMLAADAFKGINTTVDGLLRLIPIGTFLWS